MHNPGRASSIVSMIHNVFHILIYGLLSFYIAERAEVAMLLLPFLLPQKGKTNKKANGKEEVGEHINDLQTGHSDFVQFFPVSSIN